MNDRLRRLWYCRRHQTHAGYVRHRVWCTRLLTLILSGILSTHEQQQQHYARCRHADKPSPVVHRAGPQQDARLIQEIDNESHVWQPAGDRLKQPLVLAGRVPRDAVAMALVHLPTLDGEDRCISELRASIRLTSHPGILESLTAARAAIARGEMHEVKHLKLYATSLDLLTAACNASIPLSATKRRNGFKSCSMWSYCLQQSEHPVWSERQCKGCSQVAGPWRCKCVQQGGGHCPSGSPQLAALQLRKVQPFTEARRRRPGVHIVRRDCFCGTTMAIPLIVLAVCWLPMPVFMHQTLRTPDTSLMFALPGVVIGRKRAPVLQ